MKPRVLLFDLDQTLLSSQTQRLKYHFIFRSLQGLRRRGFGYREAFQFLNDLKEALRKGDESQSNATRVYESLRKRKPSLELVQAKNWVDQWIEEVFDGLLHYFHPIPEAEALFFELKKRQLFRFILATNPAWPQKVTEKRLLRGRLSLADFEWVTAAEELHFTKPDVRYYHEILKRLQVSPQECLMIGDSFMKDSVAALAGIPVFIVSSHEKVHSAFLSQGSLKTLKERLLSCD